MALPPHIEKVVESAITLSKKDESDALILTLDNVQAELMAQHADRHLGGARLYARQKLSNGASLYMVSTRPQCDEPNHLGAVWFVEAKWAEFEVLNRSGLELKSEHVWWPDEHHVFERVGIDDWVREYPYNFWRPTWLTGDQTIAPEIPLSPGDRVRTSWQVLMELE